MKATIHAKFQDRPEMAEAKAILNACVHCGFCTATCPTYQELNDERDGPRGRIYLIKQLLETGEATERSRTHMDRCLNCRGCETTCPSGVRYGRLIDIARDLAEAEIPRPMSKRLMRWSLRQVLSYPSRFGPLLHLGQAFQPLMPNIIKRKIPPRKQALPWPERRHERVMLALAGCAQPQATPNTNAAAARVLDRLGISLIEPSKAGCCGALSYHLGAVEQGLDFMRRNIDAWWPAVQSGAEAIVTTASGCGVLVKDYGELLAHDPTYAEKARKIAELTRDLSEILAQEDLSKLNLTNSDKKIAVHCPCTLQHGQQLAGTVDHILRKAGISLAKTTEKHLCCGSAGTYSILQPKMSQRLLKRKLAALTGDQPEEIVTANVGCQLHLETKSPVPVRHWIELLDDKTSVVA